MGRTRIETYETVSFSKAQTEYLIQYLEDLGVDYNIQRTPKEVYSERRRDSSRKIIYIRAMVTQREHNMIMNRKTKIRQTK